MDLSLHNKFFKPTKTRVLGKIREQNRGSVNWITNGIWAIKRPFTPSVVEDYKFVDDEKIEDRLNDFDSKSAGFLEELELTNVVILVPPMSEGNKKTKEAMYVKLMNEKHCAYINVYFLGLFESANKILFNPGKMIGKIPYPLRFETADSRLVGLLVPGQVETLLPLDKS